MAASVLLPLAAWTVPSAARVVNEDFLPAPGAVLAAPGEMARSGELWSDTWASVRRIGLGFGLAAAVSVSVPLGIVMGAFRAGQAAFELLGLLRYLPAGAFIPV